MSKRRLEVLPLANGRPIQNLDVSDRDVYASSPMLYETLVNNQRIPVTTNSLASRTKIRSAIWRMHSVIRDSDANSLVMQRFDELTKFLIANKACQLSDGTNLNPLPLETEEEFAVRVRRIFGQFSKQHEKWVPEHFQTFGLSNSALFQLGTILNASTFGANEVDLMGLTFEEMIADSFDKTDNQQFFTPDPVVSFMVDLLGSELKGRILDPACGTGGFLREVANRKPKAKDLQLMGLEIDERLGWIARMNLVLHGVADPLINVTPLDGAFSNENDVLRDSVDVILTNPPFGSDVNDSRILSKFILGQKSTSRRRGILFIERSWQFLKANGLLAIVIDDAILNGTSTKDVREFLLEKFQIEAVVSLPDNAFLPYASVKTSVLLLRKSPSSAVLHKSFVAKATNIGRRSNGDEEVIFLPGGAMELKTDFPAISQAFKSKQPSNSAIDWYWTDFKSKADSSLRIDFPFHHPSREEARALLEESKHGLVSIADLCEEINDRFTPTTDFKEDLFLYTGLAHIESGTGKATQVPTASRSIKSDVKRYQPGDILFSKMRPTLKKVALADFMDTGYASSECAVLRVRRDANNQAIVPPSILAAILRSEFVQGQLIHAITGIGRPRISSRDLMAVKLPKAASEIWADAAEDLAKEESALESLREQIEVMKAEVERRENDSLIRLVKFLGGIDHVS